MARKTPISLVAVFARRRQAEAAIDELWHAGFARDRIGMVLPGENAKQATTVTASAEDRAAEGAVTGAVAGGAVNALAGAIAVATLPGLGALLVGGALTGIATGAALGSFAGPFVALGFSQRLAQQYEDAFRAGRSLVLVRAEDDVDKALTILKSHGPVSIETTGQPVTMLPV